MATLKLLEAEARRATKGYGYIVGVALADYRKTERLAPTSWVRQMCVERNLSMRFVHRWQRATRPDPENPNYTEVDKRFILVPSIAITGDMVFVKHAAGIDYVHWSRGGWHPVARDAVNDVSRELTTLVDARYYVRLNILIAVVDPTFELIKDVKSRARSASLHEGPTEALHLTMLAAFCKFREDKRLMTVEDALAFFVARFHATREDIALFTRKWAATRPDPANLAYREVDEYYVNRSPHLFFGDRGFVVHELGIDFLRETLGDPKAINAEEGAPREQPLVNPRYYIRRDLYRPFEVDARPGSSLQTLALRKLGKSWEGKLGALARVPSYAGMARGFFGP
jgi:hypothetical protein